MGEIHIKIYHLHTKKMTAKKNKCCRKLLNFFDNVDG